MKLSCQVDTHQKPLQIPDPSYSETFTEKPYNPIFVRQQELSEVFSLEQTRDENGLLKLLHQKELRLQINCYENQNWNGINCYNT